MTTNALLSYFTGKSHNEALLYRKKKKKKTSLITLSRRNGHGMRTMKTTTEPACSFQWKIIDIRPLLYSGCKVRNKYACMTQKRVGKVTCHLFLLWGYNFVLAFMHLSAKNPRSFIVVSCTVSVAA